MIILSELNKNRKRRIVLDNINLSYSKKDKLNIILAENGSAKTSLINILFGLDHEFDGLYRINKKNAKKLNDREWNKIRYNNMQIVFQNFNLLEDISVNDNLYYASDCKNPLRFKKISEDLLEFFEIEFLKNELIKDISGLERECVAIARALMNNPGILILDNPTEHLTERERKRMIDFILKLSKKELIIILLTNDSSIYKIGNTVYKLSNRSKRLKKVKFKGKRHV